MSCDVGVFPFGVGKIVFTELFSGLVLTLAVESVGSCTKMGHSYRRL